MRRDSSDTTTLAAVALAVIAVACCASARNRGRRQWHHRRRRARRRGGILAVAALVAAVMLAIPPAAPACLHTPDERDDRVTIELLYFDGCPNYDELAPHLRELLAQGGSDATIELRRIATVEDAQRERFLGSPTVRVDGRDVDPGAEAREDYGMKCRLYSTEDGLLGTPPDAWILTALAGV